MACHMTPLPLFGRASPCNQRLLKSYKTEPEVEPEAEHHLALSCVWCRDTHKKKKRETEIQMGRGPMKDMTFYRRRFELLHLFNAEETVNKVISCYHE